MREELRARILTESEQWKTEKQRRAAEKKQSRGDTPTAKSDNSEDDDIVLESMTMPTPKKPPGRRKSKPVEAVEKPVGSSRLRG